MENEQPGHTHFLSEEQITALVLIERSGLMGEASIATAFDVSPARLAKWRGVFRDWFPFHAPSVHQLEAELGALRRLEHENLNLKAALKAHGIEIPIGDIMDISNEAVRGAEPPASASRTITGLAELPGKALLDERALAGVFGVTTRTIRRMIARFELPPPVMLAGKSTWIVERVLAHIEARADRAARHAEQEARRIETLSLR